MSAPPVKFEGGQDILRRLQMLTPAVSKKVQREALKTAAEPMRQRMEQLAAPRGQRYADPIAISNARGDNANVVAVAVGPTKSFFYGFEFGTINQPARPFVRPAFDASASSLIGAVQSKIWEALRKRLPGTFASSRAGAGGQLE